MTGTAVAVSTWFLCQEEHDLHANGFFLLSCSFLLGSYMFVYICSLTLHSQPSFSSLGLQQHGGWIYNRGGLRFNLQSGVMLDSIFLFSFSIPKNNYVKLLVCPFNWLWWSCWQHGVLYCQACAQALAFLTPQASVLIPAHISLQYLLC